MNGDDTRPSPDALLAKVKAEGQGKLKIYLGAAPGVGKTYEMLSDAKKKRSDGLDIVAGVIETHGRVETKALCDGLEILPKRKIGYRGHELEEMDLDGLIARKPQVALIDELARGDIFDRPIVTQLAPLPDYYPAEAYHQRYFEQHPYQGYCMGVVAPKVAKFRKQFASKLRRR